MGFLTPPPYGIRSGSGVTRSTLLGDIVSKPRTRAEWEERFAHWQKPASETEADKIVTARKRVEKALARSTFLPTRSWEIIPQGSYHNRTNVRAESDVDLCVCLTDAFFWDGPARESRNAISLEMGYTDLPFTFKDFKDHITQCVRDEFGINAVTSGNKAIHLNKDDESKVSVDIVPAYEYRILTGSTLLGGRLISETGIGFLTNGGERKINFPKHHYINGTAKNDRTNRRYKRVVRILKRIRKDISGNSSVTQEMQTAAKNAPSFLIESLVYNCPDYLFSHESIYDDVCSVLNYLEGLFADSGKASSSLLALGVHGFYEVNGIKPLFDGYQAWTISSGYAFILASKIYMGI